MRTRENKIFYLDIFCFDSTHFTSTLSDRDILQSSPFDFQLCFVAFHYILHSNNGVFISYNNVDPDYSSSQVCDGDDPVYSYPQPSEDTPTDVNIKLHENVSPGIDMPLVNMFNTLRHHLLHQLLTHKQHPPRLWMQFQPFETNVLFTCFVQLQYQGLVKYVM